MSTNSARNASRQKAAAAALEEDLAQLEETRSRIGALDGAAMDAARARQTQLTKPAGALGYLEVLSEQLAGISGMLAPDLRPRAVIVCAADHGVVVEGVSAFPQAVTGQMVANFLHGGAAVSVLAGRQDVQLTVVDVGVATDLPDHPLLRKAKIRRGTANLFRETAMTRDEAVRAVVTGIRVAEEALDAGAQLLVTGEMGIGNTTASAAIAAAFTGLPAEQVTGRGTGVDESTWLRKCRIVDGALARHKPDPTRALDVLQAVGGLEIGALAGVILAAAAARKPVVLDGIIATAGAAVAYGLCPRSRDYMIAGHASVEPGHRVLLQLLDLRPLLNLDMRLGEGTGGVLALPILEAAVATLADMATFQEAQVAGKLDEESDVDA